MLKECAHAPWHRLIGVLPLLGIVKCDVVCGKSPDDEINYCFGVTAFCCQDQPEVCCWEQIWRVWWFWIAGVITLTTLFTCCGYFCKSNSEGGRYTLLRNDSLRAFHRFRRSPSREFMSSNNEWKPHPNIALPPYTPSDPSTRGGTRDSSQPLQTMPYLEPPPPYTTVASHPQPDRAAETTALLPSAPASRDAALYCNAAPTMTTH